MLHHLYLKAQPHLKNPLNEIAPLHKQATAVSGKL